MKNAIEKKLLIHNSLSSLFRRTDRYRIFFEHFQKKRGLLLLSGGFFDL